MPKRWTAADDAALKVFDEVARSDHRELLEAEVAYRVLMVEPPVDKDGVPTGPALTIAKSRVLAKVSLVPERMRVLTQADECGGVDFIVEVDVGAWGAAPPQTRKALADHELTHVRLKIDKNGVTKRRDDGSVQLELIPDDYMLTGFNAIAERWGEHSIEVRGLALLREHGAQQLFAFAEPAAEAAPKKKGTPKRKSKVA